jgi:acyl dehydratase/NAD(P)-dependent dehydrogenase (short-subunit alcohol dehydrogenase family)
MTDDEALASRTFTLDDQFVFARLSSDWNPMHLDAGFARRSQVGAPVVHGIHNLLWAMDAVLRSFPLDVQNIKVRFQQPLFPGEVAQIRIRSRTKAAVNIEVVAAGTNVAAIRLSSEGAKLSGLPASQSRTAPQQIAAPIDVQFEQMADQAGAVEAGAGDDEIRTMFPALVDSIGPAAIRALLATSQIVGMAYPGLHSLFAGLDVSRDFASENERSLAYAVTKADPRFRSLQIDVRGSGITGRLDAFARLPPPAQANMTATSARVTSGAFVGQRALIVGGSRGLGEVTAKVLAAGGGYPVITYREGRHEAESVAAAIQQAGGQCEVIRYDALQPADRQLDGIGDIQSCYYFATGRIFLRKSALYEPEKFSTFLRYYTDGFYDLCTALARGRTGRIGIFYPSTVAIDEEANGLAEYAMAKGAGEILARYMNAFLPGVHVVSRRLPRILTDQTATVGVARAHDALDVMLPIVYEIQQIARP